MDNGQARHERLANALIRVAEELTVTPHELALYADAHIAHSLRDTVTLAEMAGIGVCMDFFGCWAEAGLAETIERAGPRLGLVQVADYVYGDRSLPSRAVPGDGVIPIKQILGWALDAGYTGGFDFELLGPRIDQAGARSRAGSP